MIVFGLGHQEYVLADSVVARFDRYRQTGLRLEAGGQLFGTFQGTTVRVERATGPRRTDKRRRDSFVPNRRAERREIARLYRQGLHYVGDWHTHPQHTPAPSRTDIDSLCETFGQSRHDLVAFMLVIVGLDLEPSNLYVGLCNGERMTRLHYEGTTAE